jgi:hypothetical protein
VRRMRSTSVAAVVPLQTPEALGGSGDEEDGD